MPKRISVFLATLAIALMPFAAAHAQFGIGGFGGGGSGSSGSSGSSGQQGTQTGSNPGSGNYGLEEAASQAHINTSLTPEAIVGRIVARALQFVGILFFLLMLYAGFLWMTARGNEKTVEKAKEMIIAAVIGLVIITAAYAITSAVLGSITGATK